MVILHISCIVGSPYRGVDVVVPQHIIAQQKIADIAFIHINNNKIAGIENQLVYNEKFSLPDLPLPFSKPDVVIFHEAYRKEYLTISVELKK